jgi:hypothetical protein
MNTGTWSSLPAHSPDRETFPGETGEIVIYDDATRQEKTRIRDLVTPIGKFNVDNTVNDIY